MIDDFKRLEVISNSKSVFRYKGDLKGHSEELKEFIAAIRNGKPSPIPYNELYTSSKATFAVLESIKRRQPILVQ